MAVDGPFVERQGLERAINWARLAGGALALGLSPFSEGAPILLTAPFALSLMTYGAVMHVVLRTAQSAKVSAWVPKANLLADALAVAAAMLLFAYQANWTTPTTAGVLLVIVGAFRLGSAGALASAAAAAIAFVAIAAYRQQTFGHVVTFGQAAGQIGNYLITALLMIGIVRELQALRSQRRAAETTLQRLAFYDELTGLPSRTLAETRLAEAVRSADPPHTQAALLLIGLNRFKEVNETFGRGLGDRLLRDLAARLRDAVRHGDTVARFGGDEFAIVMPSADRAAAALVAEKVLRDLERPFVLDDHRLEIDASIGIVVAPGHGDRVDVLFGRADLAMSAAKAAAAGSAVYGAEHEERTRNGLTVMAELRRGIAEGELVVHYQPQLDLRRQAVVGVEALVRWQHPVRGLLAPSEFMPLVEASALARPVTDWVLTAALRDRRGAFSDIGRLAVNLTGRDLLDPLLPGLIRGLLADPGLDPGSLVLEITERAIMSVPEQGVAVLDELRAFGVGLALDDFGTGYSSLAYLQRLPVTELKLDRSFIADLLINERSAAIVRATVEVAHALGMEVVAEGVEDVATAQLLGELGCDVAQGFYVARPMAAAEVAPWLARSPWTQDQVGIVDLQGTRGGHSRRG